MDTKRVSSGRLVRVDQRRRGRKWRVVLAVAVAVAVGAVVILAFRHKARRTHGGPMPPPTAHTVATGAPPPTAGTAAGTAVAPAEQVRTLVANCTKIPQRYGNALAALQDFNAAHGHAYRLEPFRPKLAAGEKTTVYYRAGFEGPANELATALRADVPRTRVDVTVTCGQDVHKLILEAVAKKVPAPEGVNVEVLNGGGIEGAASKMKEQLEANGYHVVALGNAATFDYKRTVVAAPEAAGDAARKIIALFGMKEDALEPQGYDLKVVIGDDFALAPETP